MTPAIPINKQLLLVLLILSQTACIPTITRKWDVQPVIGQVFDGTTGTPVEGARVVNLQDPRLSAMTDAHGEFTIEPVSHITLHIRMPASYIARQAWRVEHDDYDPAVSITATHAPPLSVQPTTPAIPLFRDLPPAPPGCPYGPYLLRLYEWAEAEQQPPFALYELSPDTRPIQCRDPVFRESLSQAFLRVIGRDR